jgi:thiol-disulfide isomerase/thioredoxin
MKCIICSTTEDVQKIKHLPLSEGRTGHVTLVDWTPYCEKCAKIQGDLFTKSMDELLKTRQG